MSIPIEHQRALANPDYKPGCGSELFDTKEWALIKRYGAWMEALASGKIEPYTEAQRRFLAVADGQLEAQTEFELVWVKLTRMLEQGLLADGNRQFGTVAEKNCSRCQEPISPDRLEVFPDSLLCRRCQENVELQQDAPDVEDLYCPRCAERGLESKLVYRKARDPEISGYFLGCANFPDCRYTEN